MNPTSNFNGAPDAHSFLKKLPIRNTPLNELHYYSLFDKKFDSYTGPFTNLEARCEPGCNENNLMPKEFNKTDYVYNQVSEVAHKHDHQYNTAEQAEDSSRVHQEKLQADREMLTALSQLTPNSFSERFQKWIAQAIIGLKVKLGLGHAEQVDTDLDTEFGHELHKPIIRKFKRRAVYLTGLDHTWAADLVIMSTADNGYRNILTVLDIFSKYAWAVPLKTKTNKELVKAFSGIFATSSRKPKKLWCDHGTEFYGAEFQVFLMEHGIQLYSTFSELKSCIVERFNRTLKGKMWQKFTTRQASNKWVDILPICVDEYNSSVHRTTGLTPIDASKPENESQVKAKVNKKITKWVTRPPKFSVGDNVRIYQWKDTFAKGYKPNYTSEVFRIKQLHETIPYTYTIEDKSGEVISGKMYEYEMIHSQFNMDTKWVKP